MTARVEDLSVSARTLHDRLPTLEAKAVFLERIAVYGDTESSHRNIGLSWTALLQQHYDIRFNEPISPTMVALMMAAMKLQRSTKVYHADNYLDLSVYLDFASAFQEAESIFERSSRMMP